MVADFSGLAADWVVVPRIVDESVLVAAVRRCAVESEHDLLNQSRYQRWRAALPDPSSVPSSIAFGNAVEFVKFAQEHGVNCLDAQERKKVVSMSFLSDRQVLEVLEVFVAETDGPHSMRRYRLWREARVDAGTPTPSVQAIKERFGSWANALPDSAEKAEAAHCLTARARWERFAEEVEVVEAEIGLSPRAKAWDRLRVERPDLELHSAKSIMFRKSMPWAEFVAPDRSWPERIDEIIADAEAA